MSGSWDCPHELNSKCQKVRNRPCDPGMKGCVLAGRFTFSNPEKNLQVSSADKQNNTTSSKRKKQL